MKSIKKLTLRKETVVSLEGQEMEQLRGGAITGIVSCDLVNGMCPTDVCTESNFTCGSVNIGCAVAGYTAACYPPNLGGNVVASGAATCAGYTWGYVC